MIHKALENSTLSLIENGTRIKSNVKVSGRSTIILREIPSDAPEEEVREIFNYEGCKHIASMRSDIGDTWFVVLESEEDAKDTLIDLRLKKRTFRGQPVKGRVKSETIARSFYPVQPPPPIVFPNMQFPIMGAPNMIPGPFSPFMMVPGMMPGGMIPVALASPLGAVAPIIDGEVTKIEATASHDSNNADGTTTTSHSGHADNAHGPVSADAKNGRGSGRNGAQQQQNGSAPNAGASKDAKDASTRQKATAKDAGKDTGKKGSANAPASGTGGAGGAGRSGAGNKSRDGRSNNTRKDGGNAAAAPKSNSPPIEISTVNFPPLVAPSHGAEGDSTSARKSEDEHTVSHHLSESFAAAAAGLAHHSGTPKSNESSPRVAPSVTVPNTVAAVESASVPVIEVTFGDISVTAVAATATAPAEVVLPSAATSVAAAPASKGAGSWAALVKASPGPSADTSTKPTPPSSSSAATATSKSSAPANKSKSSSSGNYSSSSNGNHSEDRKERRREKKSESSQERPSSDSSLHRNLANLNLPKDAQLNFTGDIETTEVSYRSSIVAVLYISINMTRNLL